MATKQEVSDYINNNYQTVLTEEEIGKIDAILNPETATILIKLLGDVSFLNITFLRTLIFLCLGVLVYWLIIKKIIDMYINEKKDKIY